MKKLLIALLITLHLFSVSVAQNIAINTDGSAPHASAALDVKSTDKGMLIPRMTTAQRTAIANVVKGLLVFDNTTSSFWFYSGTAWTELSSGANQWNQSGNNISTKNAGNVGIGTASPTQKLEVNGNILSKGRIDADGVIEGSGLSSTGSLYVQGTSLLGGNIVANGTASFNGNINSNTGISINDAAGTLQFKSTSEEKGFVQLSGDNLRLGTYSTNTTGNVIIRTGGANHVTVTNSGNVGIGTESPDQNLHVQGTVKISSGKIIDDDNKSLVPIAWGFFNQSGTKLRGSQNISVVVTDIIGGVYMKYRVQVLNYPDLSDACVVVTPRNEQEKLASTKWENGQLKIWFSADNFYSQGIASAFSVIIYR